MGKWLLSAAFFVACAALSYATGTLGRFLLLFAAITASGFVARVTLLKALAWWYYGGGYRVRRFVRHRR